MPVQDSSSSSSSSPVRSGRRPPRSFSFTNIISDLIHKRPQPQQQQQAANEQSSPSRMMRSRGSSAGDVEALGRCPYSAVQKRPGVPYEFTMPLHYPRYTRQQYEAMPEWQIDRLLEEYGLPAQEMGSLDDKRQYAMGAFLWE